MIYFDNAATSFPKPPKMLEYLTRFLTDIGGNPGRSGHTASVEAARIIFEAREKLTAFINGEDSRRLIFTQNGTESLNLAILGLLHPGDHIITTSMEHNSVMRPLTFLRDTRNVEYSMAQCSGNGEVDPADIQKLIKKNTKAIVVNHGSNVVGTVQPLKAIRDVIGDLILIVDACQTIGSIPIDVLSGGIDVLCFSCHKALYATQGLGALYMREGVDPVPIKFGGTGSKSEHIEQPDFLPDKYESGTPNTPGIASLLGGLTFIEENGLDRIISRKKDIRRRLIDSLSGVGAITIYGNTDDSGSLPVLSINVKGRSPSEVGYALDRSGIYVRVGLHCSPAAHQTISTFPAGTVRISPGYFTTDSDIDTFLEVLGTIVRN